MYIFVFPLPAVGSKGIVIYGCPYVVCLLTPVLLDTISVQLLEGF